MASEFDALVNKLNKQIGKDVVTLGLQDYDFERIPFTSPALNYCTYGGLPEGTIIEFHGPEHGGKTTTALDVVANYQLKYPDRRILYVDSENTLNTEWARKLGVDVDSMVIFHPDVTQSAEQIFQFMLDAVRTGEVGLWVLDSIPALVPQQEMDKTLEEKVYAGISKELTRFAHQVITPMKRYHCTGIGINQERENIGSMFGGVTTPGGKAWKHFCSVRLRFLRGSFFDANNKDVTRGCDHPYGNRVKLNVEKNKSCPPSRQNGQYTLNYFTGIDYIADLVEVAQYFEIISKSGAWYDIIDPTTGELLSKRLHGASEVQAFLSDSNNIEVLQKIESLLDKKIRDVTII